MIKSIRNGEHYSWGKNCSGWHLVKTEELSVIQELMPPGTEEEAHFHRQAQQFFYILSGRALFEVEGKEVKVEAQRGVHIKPGTLHQIKNTGSEDLHFLVISQPTSRGDRYKAGEDALGNTNFHNRYFKSLSNTTNGEVGENTIFHYRQNGKIIWATYEGGAIIFGTLSGRITDGGQLEFSYQHQNSQNEFMTGHCVSTPYLLENGKIRLRERWQWTCGDYSAGESELEEV